MFHLPDLCSFHPEKESMTCWLKAKYLRFTTRHSRERSYATGTYPGVISMGVAHQMGNTPSKGGMDTEGLKCQRSCWGWCVDCSIAQRIKLYWPYACANKPSWRSWFAWGPGLSVGWRASTWTEAVQSNVCVTATAGKAEFLKAYLYLLWSW